MVAAPPPKGVYVPVPTFFTSTPQDPTPTPYATPLDIPTQVAHSLYLAQSGIKGLVLLGSTGEAVHITALERRALLRGVRRGLAEAGYPEYPIIAGTATQGVEETVGLLREAGEEGVGWGLCLVPGYFASAVSQSGIVEWFTAVADRSPIPVLVYHYPGVSNAVALTPSTMAQLSTHPNIVGCKLSHGALDDVALMALSPSIPHDKFHTYTGLGQVLLPALTVGAAGAIDGLAAFFPKTVVRLYTLFTSHVSGGGGGGGGALDAETLDEMRALQYRIAAGEKMVARWGVLGVKEGVRRLRGFGGEEGGRAPLRGGFPGGEEEWRVWEGAMSVLEEGEARL